MMELRNEYQQLTMSQRESFGTLWAAATAFVALSAGAQALEAASLTLPILSPLASIAMFEAGWPAAGMLVVFVNPLACVPAFFAAQKARRMFFAAAAKRRAANMARRSAARSAGQPRSMP